MNWEDYQKDFLWFAYIGITPDEVTDKKRSIKACVERAYLDMCRTLSIQNKDFGKDYSQKLVDVFSFNGNVISTKTELFELRNNAYNIFYDDSYELWDRLKDYLSLKKCNDETKRNDKKFYYGQAQKWINMTLKYMWLVGLIEGEAVEELEAPIDTYVMKAADEAFDILFPVDNNNIENWEKYKYNTMPWSKLYKNEYEKIQQSIKNNVTGKYHSVIEWECKAWIEQAKKEKEI